MALEDLHFEIRPVRKATLPFFYTAPLALVVMGGLLMGWGVLALSTPWSSYTLALTHVFTLGFVTLSALGLVYLLLGILGSQPTVPMRVSHAVYWLLLVGAAGLVWGTANASAQPVSLAIACVGAMAVLFLWHAGRGLRRATGQGMTRRGLKFALWGFLGVAFLGVWIAHGHAGMRFPGPRVLWTQSHAMMGLLAWVGVLIMTFSCEVWPRLQGGRPLPSRVLNGLLGLVGLGGVGLAILLFVAYFFLPFEGAVSLEPWLILLFIPMALAVWGLHPFWALRSLRGAPGTGGLLFWRTGLCLGPLVIGSGGLAWLGGEPRLAILFGWLALYGWAGFLICGALFGAARPLVLAPEEGVPLQDGPWQRVSFLLHLGGLVAGGVGILLQQDVWVRAAGVLILIHGLELAAWLIRNLRAPTSRATA